MKMEGNDFKILSALETWIIPDDFFYKKICGNGWVLIGDAAVLANPLSGEGIFKAATSAKIAADVITGRFRKTIFRKNVCISIKF